MLGFRQDGSESRNGKQNPGGTKMKTILACLILCLSGVAACGLLGSDEGSPRTIVFSARSDDGTFQIFSMREDGSGIKQLTAGEYSSTEPAWSPDGGALPMPIRPAARPGRPCG